MKSLAQTCLLVTAATFATLGFVHAATSSEGATRRVALVIGHHEGGGDRERLVFAGSDASNFRRTLEELGGLRAGDATLLVDPDSARVYRALDDMEERTRALKRAGQRVEAIVYYSGHADDKGFRLGEEGFDYRLFRARLNTLGADVRIAVVDACESGALTRLKGGRAAPAFLIDKSIRSEGYAILTSSSESEMAQESDRVGGSFFTHALNTGLRGAADASRDGKVTLHEAYQFAFNETLARTQSTRGGPQHAGYEIQLTGSGDVVLTDIREASASLELSKELYGRLFIRDSLEHLSAELNKPAGATMNLGLAPGTYGLRLLQGARWHTATVTLVEGKTAPITPQIFKSVDGDPSPVLATSDVASDSLFQHVPDSIQAEFSSAFFYDVQKQPWHGIQMSLLATDAYAPRRGGQLALATNVARADYEGYQAALGVNVGGRHVHGFQLSQVGNVVSEDLRGAQFSGIFGVAGGHVRGLQASGILSIAGEGFDGWQLAGILSIAGDTVRGLQASGIFNIAGDSVRGGQAAGIFNIAGESITGGQGSGIFNISGGDIIGGQGAGIFNIAGGNIKGGQGAGIFNIAGGRVKGGQGAGIFNIAGGGVKGMQGAGIFNASGGETHGIQAAGIYNASWSLRGFQIAPIGNIAGKVNGYQIGLVNFADEYESGVPIGLVNISRKGSFEGEAWAEETGFVFAGMRFGSRWMHSQIAVGTKEVGNQRLIAPTLGAAGELAFDGTPLFMETGLLYSTIFAVDGHALNDATIESDWGRLRLGLGIKPLSFLTIVGGVSYNAIVHPFSDLPITGTDHRYLYTFNDVVTIWPGAWVGVRIGK